MATALFHDPRNPADSAGLQPYYGIAYDHLTRRSAANGSYKRDDQHRVPRFVSDMCDALAKACNERRTGVGRALVTIKDVLRVETSAAGHVDYHRKLSLYVRELEQYGPNGRP
jgi:hypothetical protein